MKKRYFPILILLVFPLMLFGQSKELLLNSIQILKLDSIASQDVPSGAPGIATAILKDGKVIYERYFGYADLADSVKIGASSRFNIASNGKQFTALAIQILIDQKKLKLEDDIRTYFPNLFPKIKEKLTLLHLLTHTSGIRDCYDLWSLQGLTWWKNTFSNTEVLALMSKQEDLNFKPGEKYLYSNTNYILLAILIEKVSGKAFVDFTDQMFRDLNMPNTSFVADYKQIQGPVARSYFNFGTWTTYDWIWNVNGDGNLFSTLADQIQWEKVIAGTAESRIRRKIISQSQKFVTGSKIQNYGYGLEFGKYKGLDYAFHEGATGAWKATVTRFPSKGVSMLTLTNTGKAIPYSQTRQMADYLFELPKDEGFFITKPAQIGKYVSVDQILGTYLTDADFAFTFIKKNDKVFLKREGRNDVELDRESDNIFRQKFDPDFKQEFTTNDQGDLQVTAYYTNHAPYSLIKTKALGNNFDFKSLEGEYFNSETDVRFSIRYVEGNNYELQRGVNSKSQGLMVSENKMLVDSYSLEFSGNEMFLFGERIKKVKFRKE
ncbi:serine hydrolase domain-containing protein [Lacihabitans soyangensis]|uniref:Class A beta-lactamase-related serine hydrolase n=1 Tax=Lacihabitans soyangensis TaxID=869394 RepID=A0AAE3KTY0_9BACT|nr:serine hydrolase domain-containing protein [Lacihabitans soyangensis]MCP9764259.1 class A beta-lactamase-related serine hydrolase [Lacihabitans soyangensis]